MKDDKGGSGSHGLATDHPLLRHRPDHASQSVKFSSMLVARHSNQAESLQSCTHVQIYFGCLLYPTLEAGATCQVNSSCIAPAIFLVQMSQICCFGHVWPTAGVLRFTYILHCKHLTVTLPCMYCCLEQHCKSTTQSHACTTIATMLSGNGIHQIWMENCTSKFTLQISTPIPRSRLAQSPHRHSICMPGLAAGRS